METSLDPIFGLAIPVQVPGVPAEILQPRKTWSDPSAYDQAAARLAQMFHKEFAKFAEGVSEEIRAAGPKLG
jgi:phosphoenolpyruvate carboxykinase (ATP)